jgi:hypothetical protein
MTKIPSVEQEILKWMNAYIPTGKTIPVFEDMLEQYATEQREAGAREERESETTMNVFIEKKLIGSVINGKYEYIGHTAK